jgi:hypothetical protein
VGAPNALRWDGAHGHYEVYYLTFTDPGSGVGVWIRYTMLAPLSSPATAALWFLAMDPNDGVVGRKQTLEIERLTHEADPFELRIGDATLTDRGMRGAFEDVAWDLRWQPGRAYEHVPPALRPLASTVLVLPHADVAVSGTVALPGRALELDNVRGGQAHLWGRKHAQRWAWVHCNDFETQAGEAATDTFIDGVSVLVSRFGRTIGPATASKRQPVRANVLWLAARSMPTAGSSRGLPTTTPTVSSPIATTARRPRFACTSTSAPARSAAGRTRRR